MATIVTIDKTNALGEQYLQALAQIRDGIAKLKKIDGQRAQAIGVSAAEMESRFGISAGGGQTLSDRHTAFLAFVDTQVGAAGYEYAAKLTDLIDATFPA